jgi:DNA-binding transcriptional MerR regulator/GGDEF domain-containing protein
MYKRSPQDIKNHLQNEDAKKRVLRNIQRGREEATVTIGRAARLFNFSENKLRDWENLGLLKPLRSKDVAGQRQYTPDELNKLAIIKELIEEGGFTPGSIPPNIDEIWASIASEQYEKTSKSIDKGTEHLHLDQRIDSAYEELFWRYYGSHVLRLSLVLICQDIPDSIAGLVLPLKLNDISTLVRYPSDLPKVGKSLIGWLGLNQSFYTFLDSAPSFEYPTDFRVVPLQAVGENAPKDNTLVIVQRKARPLSLSALAVGTIRRLLAPLYEVKDWSPYFGKGMRDLLYLAPDFNSNTNITDDTLNGLADMIVRLGGKTKVDQDRWRFCCILLPEDPGLPLQQRSLIVRAQSKNSPHKISMTNISPGKYVHSLSLRAFQSGRINYRREITNAESTIALRELEGSIRSAIAVPVGSEEGNPLAVLYIVSDEVAAFSSDDEQVLRMMGRIVEELLMTYHARHYITQNLSKLIITPNVVDPLFEDFFSENEFVEDVEAMLVGLKTRMDQKGELIRKDGLPIIDDSASSEMEEPTEDIVSFISIDVDHQSYLANMYGNEMTRNLSRTIGLRINEMMQALITKHTDCKLYRIYGSRFYLLLKGIPLEEVRTKAEAMRQALEGGITIEQPTPPARSILLPEVTVRLGVSSYTYKKLEENLESDDPVNIIAEVRVKISRALDVALNMGMDEGGNVVISWYRETRGFGLWSPPKTI